MIKWTKEKCREEALKYETRSDFRKNSIVASLVASKNNWMNDICSHMKMLKHHEDYWTKDKCGELALLCKSRTEFHENYRAAFNSSIKNDWISDICSHMLPTNIKKRCIYAYEFDDNSAYIGLTYDIKNRHSRHLSNVKSPIKIQIDKNINFKLKKLTKHIKIKNAKVKEKYYLEKYKKYGWKILNIAKTGSVGGITIKWTKENCRKKALLCKTKTEFYKKYTSASSSALKNGWIDEICSHMKHPTKPRGYWNNYENCLNEAIKQGTRNKFRKSSGSFNSSIRNNWKDKIYSYMNWL